MGNFHCALNPDQAGRCLCCEVGCCNLFEVLVTRQEAADLMALRLPDVPDFDGCFAPSERPDEFALRKRADGRCVFSDGKLCKIHRLHGYAAKPLSCRIFPLHIQHWADGGISAELRYICPGVHPGGRRLGDRLDEIAILARQLGSRRMANDAVYSKSNPAPLATVRKVHAGFRQLLRDPELPWPLRLYTAARILDFHDQKSMADAIRQADDSFAPELTAFVAKARPELERELASSIRCDALVRSEFRNILAGYLRDDRPEDMSVARRLKRSLDHIRLHTGAAPLTVLNPRAPRISMLNCPAVGRRFEPSPEAAAMFGEFWFSKLDTMEFCGTQIQQMPYNTGLRHLLLAAPAARVFAAGFAFAEDADRIEFSHMHRAVRLLDVTFGRSPFFRLGITQKWLRRLTVPARFAALLHQCFR